MEFGLEEGRMNCREVSTITPWLNIVFMAHSKIIKKPRHQGKVEVTWSLSRRKLIKLKSKKQVYNRNRSRYAFLSYPGATYKWRSES